MQTKNVNLNQDQLNNTLLEKNAQLIHQQQQQPLSPASPGSPPPPLPPRAPAEVEAAGYGQPYKPVPPPKPLPASSAAAASPPPPYRMPPYPLYGEAQPPPIPGSAAAAADLQPGAGVALHTHSSKFPIEREVILSSADKNSKIPILHEYKKRTKPATIAPEGPNKQIAWTEDKRQHLQQHHTMHGPVNGSDDTLILTTRTLHSLNLGDKSMALEDMSHQLYKVQPVQVPNEASRGKDYRSQFHNPYLYNGHHTNAASTGAVPRVWGSSAQGRPPVPNQGPPTGQQQQQQQQLGAAAQLHQDTVGTGAVRRDHSGERAVQQQGTEADLTEDQNCTTENNGKDKDGKDCGDKVAGKTFSTRTYHTIKDMISSRFGSGKLPKDVNGSGADVEQGKSSQEGLNNTVMNGEAGNEKSSPRKVRPQPLTGREDAEDEQRQQRLLGGGPSVPAPTAASAQSASRGYAAGGGDAAGAASYQYQQHVSEGAGYYHHQTPVGPRSHQQQQRQKALSPMSQQQANYASQLEQAGVYMVMRQAGASASTAASSSQYHQTQQQYHIAGQQDRADSGSGYATANLAGGPSLPMQKQPVPAPPHSREGRRGSQSRLDLPDDEDDDDEGGFVPPGGSAPPPPPPSTEPPRTASSGQSSDYEKATQRSTGQSSSTAGDSGRGSTVYSSGRQPSVGGSSGGGGSVGGAGLPPQKDRLDTSTESSGSPRVGYGLHHQPPGAGAEPEWVDVVENELRQILDPKLHGLGAGSAVGGGGGGANSTLSESISSLTPPLPPLSPGGSPTPAPRSYKHGNSLPYGSKLGDYDGGSSRKGLAPLHQQSTSGKPRGGRLPGGGGGGAGKPGSGATAFDKHHRSAASGGAGSRSNKDSKNKQLSASVFGLDTTDLTSTTTGGLDSVLDGHTENNSSDDDLSTTIDATDAQAIRRQLEGLESMYSEVLKLLGVKKSGSRYPPSDPPRLSQRRRVYGSLSSLPSSASSRPPATRPHERRRHDDHRKKVRDLKGINKRFQRLESHVVTLARSVAHLSSEMRTQHLMIQEMENIRGEIAALRTQTALHHHRSQSVPRALNVAGAGPQGDSAGGLSNPSRVRKLTKFFGDEPPLLRLFLRRLGYEKYANVFENERVGMVELPYLTEERLQRMGVPLGPRIRILQEAQNFPPAPAQTAAQAAPTPSSRHDKVYVV